LKTYSQLKSFQLQESTLSSFQQVPRHAVREATVNGFFTKTKEEQIGDWWTQRQKRQKELEAQKALEEQIALEQAQSKDKGKKKE
jgi:hypothetical protein